MTPAKDLRVGRTYRKTRRPGNRYFVASRSTLQEVVERAQERRRKGGRMTAEESNLEAMFMAHPDHVLVTYFMRGTDPMSTSVRKDRRGRRLRRGQFELRRRVALPPDYPFREVSTLPSYGGAR